MPVNPTDLRFIKSDESIQVAFLELLDTAPIEEISVTQICQRARCSRNAFYAHYTDKYELYNCVIDQLLEAIHDVGRRTDVTPEKRRENALISSFDFFDTVMAQRTLWKRLLKYDNGVVRHKLVQAVTEVYLEETYELSGKEASQQQQLICAFGAAGNMAYMFECILNPDINREQARKVFGELQREVTVLSMTYMDKS